MRLRRRKCHVTVAVQRGPLPILIGFGFATFEATVDEARELRAELDAAIEQAQP